MSIQVYTYHIRTLHGVRVGEENRQQQQQQHDDDQDDEDHSSSRSGSSSDVAADLSVPARRSGSSGSNTAAIVGYELQLVMEYCALVSDSLTDQQTYMLAGLLQWCTSLLLVHCHARSYNHPQLLIFAVSHPCCYKDITYQCLTLPLLLLYAGFST